MNLIYYNSFAEHMRKTYTSDCSIYLESRGVMELMACTFRYIVSESRLPLMGTDSVFSRFVFCTKAGQRRLLVVLSTERREAYEGDITAEIIKDIREFREGVEK